MHGRVHVGVVRAPRVLQRPRDAWQGSEVVDHFDALDRACRDCRVAQVAELKVDLLRDVGEVGATPRRQIVDHAHLVAEGQQAIDDV